MEKELLQSYTIEQNEKWSQFNVTDYVKVKQLNGFGRLQGIEKDTLPNWRGEGESEATLLEDYLCRRMDVKEGWEEMVTEITRHM